MPKPFYVDITNHWRAESAIEVRGEYYCTFVIVNNKRAYINSPIVKDWLAEMDNDA